MEPNSEIPTRPKRRWWLGVVFAILGLFIVAGVVLLLPPSAPNYAFLKGAKQDWFDETISPPMVGGPTYFRSIDYVSDQSFLELGAKAEPELAKEGYTVASREANTLSFIKPPLGSYIIIVKTASSTIIHTSEIRPPTAIDRARLWVKSLFPKPKAGNR